MEPSLPQHDETIQPVRPGLRSVPHGAAPERAPPPTLVAPKGRISSALASGGALVLVAAVVFLWLPRWVESERVAQPAAPVPAEPVAPQPTGPVLSVEETAALKVQAENLLASLLTVQTELRALHLANWAVDDEQRYQELSDSGDNAFLADDFATAVARYTEAQALADGLVARAAGIVEGSFTTAEAALMAGNAELALREYDLVLAVEPTHVPALDGRARAQRLPEVLAVVLRADNEAQRGEWQTALASYREALALDSEWPAAQAGVAAANRALRDAEFERQMSAGFASLGSDEFAAARAAFEAALALRPGAEAAIDGLAQADQGAKLDEIALTEARALAFERRELWDQAIMLYRAVLSTDATLLFAQTGLKRAEARAGLDAKLAHLIDNPTLLFTDSILADATKLLESANAEVAKGPRIAGQIDQLGRLIGLATEPIPVELKSDQVTQVTLYRVGALGAFAAKQVELRPGTYTVIGSRDGYRDVRQTFTVRPGRNLPPIDVVCVEPI